MNEEIGATKFYPCYASKKSPKAKRQGAFFLYAQVQRINRINELKPRHDFGLFVFFDNSLYSVF
jgi:hypothetical protein